MVAPSLWMVAEVPSASIVIDSEEEEEDGAELAAGMGPDDQQTPLTL